MEEKKVVNISQKTDEELAELAKGISIEAIEIVLEMKKAWREEAEN